MSFNILLSASKRSKNAIRGSRTSRTSAKTRVKVDELKIIESIGYYWRIIFSLLILFNRVMASFQNFVFFIYFFNLLHFYFLFFCLAKKWEGGGEVLHGSPGHPVDAAPVEAWKRNETRI